MYRQHISGLMRNFYRTPRVAAIIIFVLSAASASIFIGWLEHGRVEIEKTRVADMANDTTAAVQHAIERALSATYAISALVQQGNGKVDNFTAIAGKMLPMYPGVDSLQLAPGGVVRQIVPLSGNEKALGHDLFRDTARATEAIVTRDSRQLTFAGPFPLIQGPFLGGIGRLPIYLEDEDGEQYFWGFTNVVIRFPEVLDDTGLHQMEEKGFSYQLWRYHPDTGKKQIIASSPCGLAGEPVERFLQVPGTAWVLSITPKNGWTDYRSLAIEILVGFIFSLMAAWSAKQTAELKIREAMLERMALLDELTGLPNRRLLTSRLEQAMAQALQTGHLLAICYLDIDNFKVVNDQLGHAAGDKLLVEVAGTVQSCLRARDTLARMGGDEFVIVLQGLNGKEECKIILERILRKVSTAMVVSTSIGVTLYPEDDSDTDLLLRHADYAMYQAKQTGKNKYCLFSQDA